MQTNRFKIYSYPYFAEFTSDYKKAEFHIEGRAEYDSSNESIIFGINYSINNDYINKLISNDEIRVAVRIACKPLGFQKTINIPSNAQSIKYVINSLDVDGDVDIDAFLVTNKDIKLSDSSFSKDWEGEEPFVERGNVIGESNTYVISTDHYRDGGKQSIVSFTEVRAMNDKEYFDVDLSGDRIVFRLSSRMYKHYNKVSKKNEESVIVDFLIPEFTSILQQMKEDENGDNTFNAYYKNKEWYKVISNKYEKELRRDPCTSDINPLVAAQMLLKVGTKKLNAAFKEMDYIVKTREGGAKND